MSKIKFRPYGLVAFIFLFFLTLNFVKMVYSDYSYVFLEDELYSYTNSKGMEEGDCKYYYINATVQFEGWNKYSLDEVEEINDCIVSVKGTVEKKKWFIVNESLACLTDGNITLDYLYQRNSIKWEIAVIIENDFYIKFQNTTFTFSSYAGGLKINNTIVLYDISTLIITLNEKRELNKTRLEVFNEEEFIYGKDYNINYTNPNNSLTIITDDSYLFAINVIDDLNPSISGNIYTIWTEKYPLYTGFSYKEERTYYDKMDANKIWTEDHNHYYGTYTFQNFSDYFVSGDDNVYDEYQGHSYVWGYETHSSHIARLDIIDKQLSEDPIYEVLVYFDNDNGNCWNLMFMNTTDISNAYGFGIYFLDNDNRLIFYIYNQNEGHVYQNFYSIEDDTGWYKIRLKINSSTDTVTYEVDYDNVVYTRDYSVRLDNTFEITHFIMRTYAWGYDDLQVDSISIVGEPMQDSWNFDSLDGVDEYWKNHPYELGDCDCKIISGKSNVAVVFKIYIDEEPIYADLTIMNDFITEHTFKQLVISFWSIPGGNNTKLELNTTTYKNGTYQIQINQSDIVDMGGYYQISIKIYYMLVDKEYYETEYNLEFKLSVNNMSGSKRGYYLNGSVNTTFTYDTIDYMESFSHQLNDTLYYLVESKFKVEIQLTNGSTKLCKLMISGRYEHFMVYLINVSGISYQHDKLGTYNDTLQIDYDYFIFDKENKSCMISIRVYMEYKLAYESHSDFLTDAIVFAVNILILFILPMVFYKYTNKASMFFVGMLISGVVFLSTGLMSKMYMWFYILGSLVLIYLYYRKQKRSGVTIDNGNI